jgi:hypothetical protein
MKIIIAPSPRGSSHGWAVTVVTDSKEPMPSALLDTRQGTFQTHTHEPIEVSYEGTTPLSLEAR